MNPKKSNATSTLTKLQQSFWEAKRNIRMSLGQKDDDCLIANDETLDGKLDIFETAAQNFDNLMYILKAYNKVLFNLTTAEEKFSGKLTEYGVKDTTKAGRMMSICGKTLNRCSSKRMNLRNAVIKLYHEVQNFHFKASVDVLFSVDKMERHRKSYRSALLWMKNESKALNPEDARKMNKFRRIQGHVKKLKLQFDRSKLEVMQKIDLYLFSRSNLFSKTLVIYQNVFCKISTYYVSMSKSAIQAIPPSLTFKFVMLKDLQKNLVAPPDLIVRSGDGSDSSYECGQSLLFQVTSQDNTSDPQSNPTNCSMHETENKSETNTEQRLINFTDETDNPFPNVNRSNDPSSLQDILQSMGNYSSDLSLIDMPNTHDTAPNCLLKSPPNTLNMEYQTQDKPKYVNSYSDGWSQGIDSSLQFWEIMENSAGQDILVNDHEEEHVEKRKDQMDSKFFQKPLWKEVLMEFDPVTSKHLPTKAESETC